MNLRERSENKSESELRARLAVLQSMPPPDLARGRARVLAAAQKRAAAALPRQFSFAFAFGVGLAVILVMVVMSSAMGAVPLATVALTRTDTVQARTAAPVVVPANALPLKSIDSLTQSAVRTPAPGAVPEPPRSPVLSSTQTLSP